MRQQRQQLDEELGRLFESYGRSVPEIDASPDFLPGIWRKIEQRRALGWLAPLLLWSPRLAAAGTLAAAILVGALWLSSRAMIDSVLLEESYVDALTADSMDEHDGSLWLQAGNRR
jgi:hypothetical protein